MEITTIAVTRQSWFSRWRRRSVKGASHGACG